MNPTLTEPDDERTDPDNTNIETLFLCVRLESDNHKFFSTFRRLRIAGTGCTPESDVSDDKKWKDKLIPLHQRKL